MNWKNRFTNYNFWISIVSAVLLILQAFKFQFDIVYINEIATAVLGLLVVIGIINDPTKTSVKIENSAVKKETKKVDKVEETNVIKEEENTEVCVEKSEEKIETNSEDVNNVENGEESFPIDEQGKIDAESNENDFEDLVEKISADINEEENNFKEMFKNLLNLLKSNEETESFKTKVEETPVEIKVEEKTEELREEKPDVIEEIAVENNVENNLKNSEEQQITVSSFNIVN